MKIFQRSLKDLNWRSFKDLKKIFGRNIFKIFRRKCFHENLRKIFYSKNLNKVFWRNLAKIFQRLRSREDLHKRSSWGLILWKISKKIWFLGDHFSYSYRNVLLLILFGIQFLILFERFTVLITNGLYILIHIKKLFLKKSILYRALGADQNCIEEYF